ASGAVRGAAGVEAVKAADVAAYAGHFAEWIGQLDRAEGSSYPPVGLVQVRDTAHYVFVTPFAGERGGFLAVGSTFDSSVFTSKLSEGFSGLDVRIVNRSVAVSAGIAPAPRGGEKGDGGPSFGIAPMLSEALNFYSGGFWSLGANPFEALFAVRDIAGNAVSMITVSLPASLATVTRSALGRFTFFVAMTGIILIIPIFWFQGRVLLNPLTRMTEAIRRLGERHRDFDCPRLEWEGRDEFAMLAMSVNRMLETISTRAIKVAQVEARHRALIDGLPDALAVFDKKGRLVSITKQPEGTSPLTGLTIGEEPSAAVYGPAEVASFVAAVADVFRTNAVANVRLKVRRPPGGAREVPTRHFEVRITRMDEVFALAIVRDVSEEVAEHKLRLAAESRMRDSLKRESLTVLAAGIAHDVNNVLSVILSTVEAAEPGTGRIDADVVREAVRRGSRMMKELMTFAGDNKVSLLRASPDFFVHDVQTLTARVVGENVAISYRLAKGLPDVDADPNQFWKVLFNIVKNAGEALGDRPGHIVISTEACDMTPELAQSFMSSAPLAPGRGVLFCIEDDGPGVPPDILPRLFDPYVSSKNLGRGLGLATVRSIVETHGGGLKVESALGKGTKFSIFLPQTRIALGAAPSAGDAPGESGALPAEVLVVDDDEAILKTLSMLLKSLGVVARLARNRDEALGVMRRHANEVGAVLMDAHLGDVDVVRLFEAFRTASRGVPIVIVSGSSEEDIRKMFKGRDFSAFLGKPFTRSELKDVLNAALGGGRAGIMV
ncbi:MAG: response regulator, partial [Kiritimatiellae bacterium]|nr:response regulator [Kiritimatiellia bacterium]